MNMSPQINELAAALSKAQGAMKAASKDALNPFFKSHYATLASVIEAIREPFAANGLSFCQPLRVDEHGNIFVTTVLLHASGQWISGEVSAKPVKNDPQGIGSLISYLKRYGLQAMVGVASEDDDANEASGKGASGKGHSQTADKTRPLVKYEGKQDQKAQLMKVASGLGLNDVDQMKRLHGICLNNVDMQDLEYTVKMFIKDLGATA